MKFCPEAIAKQEKKKIRGGERKTGGGGERKREGGGAFVLCWVHHPPVILVLAERTKMPLD